MPFHCRKYTLPIRLVHIVIGRVLYTLGAFCMIFNALYLQVVTQ